MQFGCTDSGPGVVPYQEISLNSQVGYYCRRSYFAINDASVCVYYEEPRVLHDFIVFLEGGVLILRYSVLCGYPPGGGNQGPYPLN